MRMRYIKSILIPVLLLVGLMFMPLSAKIESWDTFSHSGLHQSGKRSGRADIVIIRPHNLGGRAINIYIDGEYITSLLPGAYTEQRVCPGTHRVNLAYTNKFSRYRAKRSGGERILFKVGERRVYLLQKKGGKLHFVHYSTQDIPSLLQKYRKRQSHTISRYSRKKCTQPVRTR